ncbi:MAG: sulfotransferase [Actinobacteria bacterium]|nr:sulfotransferase [Actinomycetota bacterium]
MTPPSAADSRLIVVVGARRSGTYLVQRLLCTHPDVVGIHSETYLFSRGLPPLFERVHHGLPASLRVGSTYADRERLIASVRDLCDELFASHRADPSQWLVERTPEHIHHLELITELYPDVRVVHVLRNGYAVVRSLLHQPWGPTRAVSAAREWRDAVRAGRAGAPRVRSYVEVRHEQLTTDPVAAMEGLLGALGLPVPEHVRDAIVAEARVVRSTRGARAGAGTMTRRQVRTVARVAGPLLDELGYEPSEPLARASRRVARAGRVLRTLASRLHPRPAAAGEGGAGYTPHVHQVLVDDLLTALRTGGRLDGLVAQEATLRIVGPGGGSWRGPGAVTAFQHALAGDPLVDGDYVSADIHPGGGLVVLSAALTGHGGAVDRTVVVRPSGSHIAEWSSTVTR